MKLEKLSILKKDLLRSEKLKSKDKSDIEQELLNYDAAALVSTFDDACELIKSLAAEIEIRQV